jgi:hypothetical protein
MSATEAITRSKPIVVAFAAFLGKCIFPLSLKVYRKAQKKLRKNHNMLELLFKTCLENIFHSIVGKITSHSRVLHRELAERCRKPISAADDGFLTV